jgi:hypothetical protein
MIRYALRCREAHDFEAWFASSGNFDRLKAAGHVTCPVCGGDGVEKALMAPAVASSVKDAAENAPAADKRPLSEPATAVERALTELRRKVEATAENVGRDFPHEARRIHAGDAPQRPIWGEARSAEARALVEDGIPVAALPFPARRGH